MTLQELIDDLNTLIEDGVSGDNEVVILVGDRAFDILGISIGPYAGAPWYVMANVASERPGKKAETLDDLHQKISWKREPRGFVVTCNGRVPGDSRAYATAAQAEEAARNLVALDPKFRTLVPARE